MSIESRVDIDGREKPSAHDSLFSYSFDCSIYSVHVARNVNESGRWVGGHKSGGAWQVQEVCSLDQGVTDAWPWETAVPQS